MKKVILHRKNAMFYLTDNGAQVGDMYMSLIYTCQLCGANPFDYLTEFDPRDSVWTPPSQIARDLHVPDRTLRCSLRRRWRHMHDSR